MGCYVGRSETRVDAIGKVTGQVKYPSDIYFPEMLHLHLVRSTIPHGLITKIELYGTLPQGTSIFTAADIPNNLAGSILKDQPILAREKVRFYGEPIVLVAAPSPKMAETAAGMIQIDYEPLPVVSNPRESLSQKIVALHPQGNLVLEMHAKNGEPEIAFAQSDLVIEDHFSLPVVDHLCLETEGGVAFWDDDVLTLEVGTQNPFYDRREIAHVLSIPENKIRVCCPQTGGGFGGKDGNTVQLFLALAAWKTGKPCRLVFTREESLLSTFKRHAADIWMKIGFSKNGDIKGFQAQLYYDTGAYAALGPATLGAGVETCAGPYVISDMQIDGYLCYTNKPPASAMRGFGAIQPAFAVETLINRAARKLGLDPLLMREQNALQVGSQGILGHTLEYSVGLKEALHQVKKMPLWRESKANKDPLVGYGLAVGFLGSGMGKGILDEAEVEIERNEDGTYLLKIGVVDIGQGNTTAFAQIAAADLGVPIEKVRVIMADTGICYDCGSTAASRTTYIAGKALQIAIKDLKNNFSSKGQVIGKGRVNFPEVGNFSQQLGPGLPHAIYGFIVQVVKIVLDKETGSVTLAAVDAVTDAGHIINPSIFEGQIQGGIAMAAGYALMEEIVYTSGMPETIDLTTYLLPTSMDLPDTRSEAVLVKEESGPYGAKGCAELGTLALAPAIVGAISSIVGYEPTKLPIKMEQIYKIIHER